MARRPPAPATVAVAVGRSLDAGEPLNPPVVLASSFRGGPGYARTHGTDGWAAFEDVVGALEGGEAVAFASGMAAVSAVIHALAPRTVVLPTSGYYAVRKLLGELAERGTLVVRDVDPTDTPAVLAAAEGADLVWVETPTNPTLEVADLPAIAAGARARGARVVVDNTFATPLRQRPLADGADVVVHSATKLMGGHSDLLLGVAVASDAGIVEALRSARTLLGATPGALEAFLALRGLRTLPVRLDRAEATARVLVDRLAAHPAVLRVRYPGTGVMVSFLIEGGAAAADAVCARVRLLVPATSLGGVETSIERRQKYAGDAHVDPALLRMSVGLEDPDDLWDDLDDALSAQG